MENQEDIIHANAENSDESGDATDRAESHPRRPHSAEDPDEDTRIYKVVINHEEQYSIWFANREPPLGWQAVGKEGRKSECLAYIDEVWTDMRPLSLRKKMAEMQNGASGTGQA